MTGAELADAAIRVYQNLGWTFLKLCAVPAVFCVAAAAFLQEFVLRDFFFTHATQKSAQAVEVAERLALAIAVGGPLFLIGVSWMCAVVTALTSDWMLGNVPDPVAAVNRARNSLFSLLLAVLRENLVALSGVLVSLALLFASTLVPDTDTFISGAATAAIGICGIVFGCLFWVGFAVLHALVPQIVFIEGIKVSAAGKRSRMLLNTKQEGLDGTNAILRLVGSVFMILIAIWAGLGTLMLIIDPEHLLKSFYPGSLLNAVLGQLFSLLPLFILFWLVMPFWAAGVTLIYYECRVRIEGFDIEMLAGDVWKSESRGRFQL